MATQKSELQELERIGATPTKNSGRGQHNKGDGILHISDDTAFTVDVKEYSKGYRITPENWAKLNTDAKKNRTAPMLFLALGDDEPRTRVVAISEIMFKELVEVYWKYTDLQQ